MVCTALVLGWGSEVRQRPWGNKGLNLISALKFLIDQIFKWQRASQA